ncbi:kelch-like protein 38 [Diabrotica virgifera virgifera]|uniref:BTB domain-containing protein n=1 Tax=Diabrotica virgifera virgifera TaxID=50390 RepID=A0ABM5L7B0_DIAVI|nr:kelch-like protein 38 [Diabrotica virgifera virgifera]
MSCSEEVILEIEGTHLKCKKDVLISNSDYFKAMLEGNFIEKDQNTISIKDVDLKAVNIILMLLGDPTIYMEDEDILMVLHAACMLQFCEIKNMCLDKLNQIISVQNCLKIWIMAEQLDIKPLILKAKRLALTEFMTFIKENDSINDLNLQQLIRYIGSLHLVTDSELTVFQTLMKWWYGHSQDHTSDDFIKLLSCVNYKQLLPDHFRETLTYPDIANTEIEDILKCLYNILNNIPNCSCSKKCLDLASLLSQSIDRKIIIDRVPCLLVRNASNKVSNKIRLVENSQTVEGDVLVFQVCNEHEDIKTIPLKTLHKNLNILHDDDHQLVLMGAIGYTGVGGTSLSDFNENRGVHYITYTYRRGNTSWMGFDDLLEKSFFVKETKKIALRLLMYIKDIIN